MKIKLKTIMAGPDGNYKPGEEADFDENTAQALIDGGYAEPVKGSIAINSPEDNLDDITDKPLNELTLAELRELASRNGIDGRKMNTATLIKALTTV